MSDIITFIKDALAWITNYVTQTVDSLAAGVSSIYQTIKTLITSVITDLKAALQTVITTIQTALTSLMDAMKAALQAIVDQIWSIIGPIVQKITTFVSDALKYLTGLVVDGYNALVGFAYSAFQTLTADLKAVADPIIAFVTDAKDKVVAWLGNALDTLTPAVKSYNDLIKAGIEDFTKDASGFIDQVNQRLTDVASAFADTATKITEQIAATGDKLLQPITDEIKTFTKMISGFVEPDVVKQVESALMTAFSAHTLDLTDRESARQLANVLMPSSTLGKALFTIGCSLFLVQGVYAGVVAANAKVINQEFALTYHSELISPSDTALAYQRGAMDKETAVQNIVRQGFSPEDASHLLANAESVPGIGEAITFVQRGSLTADQLRDIGVRQGLADKYIEAYKDLINTLPGVSDLISMAVKGAFSPDEVATFRTDEDFPTDILEFTKKQGLSDDWTRKYWRAHWNLPSAGQGFEMFQRGIFGEEKLNILLKALDISPGWRDDLVKLSYNLLGRTDLRRMHQLGIMKRPELVEGYKKLGYSPTDAENLTTFTEELNKGKPGEADEVLGRLSRTNVVNFYQDGTIDKERAIDLLKRIGYTEEAATLFIDTADFDAERAERTANIEFIIASAQAGLLDFGAAQDQLHALHLSPIELERASAKLIREQSKATKLPSQADGEKMYTAGIIPEAEYRDLLKRLGYRSQWADAYVALAKHNAKPTKAK